MPRSIDSIMAAHEAAGALRRAGKPIWTYKVDIKPILREDQRNVTPEHVASVATRVAARLRAGLPAKFFDYSHPECDMDFLETVEFMETCTVASLAIDLDNGVPAVDMLNGWLDCIYDWAGGKGRVWLGN